MGLVRHVLRKRTDAPPALAFDKQYMGNTVCGRMAKRPSWYVVKHEIGPVCADCLKMLGTTADVDTAVR